MSLSDSQSLERTPGRAAPACVWRARMTGLIAWRNLVHDRVRFGVTIVGIAFATLLMGIQLGMLVNFMQTISAVVDRSGADLWIAAHGVKTVDLATPLEERRRFQALSTMGVASAEPYLLGFGYWKKPDGVLETVILIGVEPDATMGRPWDVLDGVNVHDALLSPDGVIVDRLYAAKLGVSRVGETFEINDRRVRVVGFTSGIRTFTQSPYVFMSLRKARSLATNLVHGGKTITYVPIRVADGFSREETRRKLAARMPDVDVLTSADFSGQSRAYWLFSTGAGVSIVSSSLLAMFVGVVIAAQTLYASTMDRLPEYATLRAMGGSRFYLYSIVIQQALIGGAIGYVFGMSAALLMAWAGRESSATPEIPLSLVLGIGLVIEVMCVLASLISLKKVTSINPAEVFR
ncbi:ABC transporter permease [uncultured Rhodoblastus sp.]|uniref:ABC transporter permease n=1 Tax=uncultured Rhodoblastus sp. TaxID=543037 RepID=UPI0025D7A54C|nr:ABC transporter permease [uncultured Rhodoblastus sp.]